VRFAREIPPLLTVAFDGAFPRQRQAVGLVEDDPLFPAVGRRPSGGISTPSIWFTVTAA